MRNSCFLGDTAAQFERKKERKKEETEKDILSVQLQKVKAKYCTIDVL
jgi:hypothetical protein